MTTLLFIVLVVYILILRRDRKKLNQVLFALIGITLEEKRHRLSYHAETEDVLNRCSVILAGSASASGTLEKEGKECL